MINWENVEYFKQYDFIDNTESMDPRLIYSLDAARVFIKQKIYPSPVKGSFTRFDEKSKTSQHYAVGRLSVAGDVFCEGYPLANLLQLCMFKKFNGIGVYLDTYGPDGKPWVMFHMDMRDSGYAKDQPIIWITEKKIVNRKKVDVYRYPQKDPQYWSLLRDERLYVARYKIAKAPTIG